MTADAKHPPLTDLGLPNFASIVPGQSDTDLAEIMKAMKKTQGRDTRAVALMYAGKLGKTAPEQEDSIDRDHHLARHTEWRASCTDLQRKLLDLASESAREKRKAAQRAEYAKEKGGAVRQYTRALTDEDKLARRAEQSREKQRRYRERQKLIKMANGTV